jgi:hypothetical protein
MDSSGYTTVGFSIRTIGTRHSVLVSNNFVIAQLLCIYNRKQYGVTDSQYMRKANEITWNRT